MESFTATLGTSMSKTARSSMPKAGKSAICCRRRANQAANLRRRNEPGVLYGGLLDAVRQMDGHTAYLKRRQELYGLDTGIE